MRVVLVVARSTGGIGTHVGQLAADLRRQGHDVLVVTAAATASHFGWDDEVDTLTWWPRGVLSSARWRGRLRELSAGADVIHAHGIQAGAAVALALLAGARPQARVVVSLHNRPPGGGLGGWAGRLLARFAVGHADLATGASSDLVALARHLGARRTRFAPVPSPLVPALLAAPVSTAAERAARVADLGLGERPLLITVSRIAPQKRLDVVVGAAGLLRHRTDVVWAVVGDGDPALRAVLESSAAGTDVHLLGARTDVPELLRAATALVVSSDWEARALAVQEAMAAGIPVVATDVGGLPDLLAGTGVLVPPGSPALLAAAVDGLLDDVLGAVRGDDRGDDRGDSMRGDLVPGISRLTERARPGREVAASWADGPATARAWAHWYAAIDP